MYTCCECSNTEDEDIVTTLFFYFFIFCLDSCIIKPRPIFFFHSFITSILYRSSPNPEDCRRSRKTFRRRARFPFLSFKKHLYSHGVPSYLRNVHVQKVEYDTIIIKNNTSFPTPFIVHLWGQKECGWMIQTLLQFIRPCVLLLSHIYPFLRTFLHTTGNHKLPIKLH